MDIIKIHKATKTQLIDYITKNQYLNYIDKENTYWILNRDNDYKKPCLVAHIDTVFDDNIEKMVFYDKKHKILYGNGIGADDRAGVYAVLELIKTNDIIVLLTDFEEYGAIGAINASKNKKLKDILYFIELDRKNSNDVVFYNNENIHCKEFAEYFYKVGFVKTIGIFSDISVLSENLLIAGANVSIGYYNNHTKHEYLKINELNNTITRIDKLLKTIPLKQYKLPKQNKIEIIQYNEYCYNCLTNKAKYFKNSWLKLCTKCYKEYKKWGLL